MLETRPNDRVRLNLESGCKYLYLQTTFSILFFIFTVVNSTKPFKPTKMDFTKKHCSNDCDITCVIRRQNCHKKNVDENRISVTILVQT